jgi:hypothetical protein
MPIAIAGYFAYGGNVSSNVVLSISDGPLRITVEVMLLLHLVITISNCFPKNRKNKVKLSTT